MQASIWALSKTPLPLPNGTRKREGNWLNMLSVPRVIKSFVSDTGFLCLLPASMKQYRQSYCFVSRAKSNPKSNPNTCLYPFWFSLKYSIEAMASMLGAQCLHVSMVEITVFEQDLSSTDLVRKKEPVLLRSWMKKEKRQRVRVSLRWSDPLSSAKHNLHRTHSKMVRGSILWTPQQWCFLS